MEYDEFIGFVRTYQTERIKPLSLPESCAPQGIPIFFGYLLNDVFKIIESHFNELSDNNAHIGIFSLQPVSLAIQSSLPKRLNRISSYPFTNYHVCCVLSYLPISAKHENSKTKIDWSRAKRLVIDFTRGIVMDEKKYLHELFHEGEDGKLYGIFNQIKLHNIWKNASYREEHPHEKISQD